MTVSAWITHLQRFDGGLDVIVRVDGEEGMHVATKPVFTVDAGCTDEDALCIDMAHEDEGIEEAWRI